MKNGEAFLSVKFNSSHTGEELLRICGEDLENLEVCQVLFKSVILQKSLQEQLVGYIFLKLKVREHPFGRNSGVIRKNTMTKATDNLLKNHLQSFLDNDLEALIADYTNESLLISPVKTYRDIGKIKGFFVDLMTHFPKLQSRFELDNKVIHDEFAYIVWHAATPTLEVSLGSDTFVVENQKIKKQTFVGQMKFI